MEFPATISMTASIPHLSLDRSYYVTMSAKSSEGASPFVQPPLIVNMPGVMGKASSSNANTDGMDGPGVGWRVPRLLLLITTLTGAALLALNIAIIACFVRRRKRERNISVSSSKTTSLGVYYAPQISSSLEDLEGSGTTPVSPLTTAHNQLIPSNQDKTLLVSPQQPQHPQHPQQHPQQQQQQQQQQQLGSSLLLQVENGQRSNRVDSNAATMSPSSTNPFLSQQSGVPKPTTIPLDLLEGSNISLGEVSLALNPGISSFSTNNANSFSTITTTSSPGQNNGGKFIDLRKLPENEDQTSLASYSSSSRAKSPLHVPSTKEDNRGQNFSEKELAQDPDESKRRGEPKRDKSKPKTTSQASLGYQQPSLIQLPPLDQDYGNESKPTQNFQNHSNGMKTLGTRRGKKEQPKFATLQKPKSSRSNYSSKFDPEELAYATINIKTSPRPRHSNIKLGSPSQMDPFPYATSPQSGGYNEPPRYINLRTFREGNAIPPQVIPDRAAAVVDPPSAADYRSASRTNTHAKPGRRSSKDSVQPKSTTNCINHEGQPDLQSPLGVPKEELRLNNSDHYRQETNPSTKPVGVAEPVKSIRRASCDTTPNEVDSHEVDKASWS